LIGRRSSAGRQLDLPWLIPTGSISGFLEPALILVASSQLTGARWPVISWVGPSRADIALCRVREQGGDGVAVYTPEPERPT